MPVRKLRESLTSNTSRMNQPEDKQISVLENKRIQTKTKQNKNKPKKIKKN